MNFKKHKDLVKKHPFFNARDICKIVNNMRVIKNVKTVFL